MKRTLKWIAIIVAVVVVLAAAAVVIVPRVVDLNRFKPRIEKQISDATGRPFTLGGEIRLSLFPRAGIVLDDLRLGNPAGFSQGDFVSIKSFELQVELLPLLSRNLVVERFVMDSPRILLVRNKKGRANWGSVAGAARKVPAAPDAARVEADLSAAGLPIQSLAVGEFDIGNGHLVYLDERTGARNEVSALNLRLEEISLDRPIGVDLSAMLDGLPVTVTGQVGPVGKELGLQPIPLDLQVAAFDELKIQLDGRLENLSSEPGFDLKVDLAPFSPRKLLAALGQPFPVQTTDANAFSRLALTAGVQGTGTAVSVAEGVLTLDDATARFSLQAKALEKPAVVFDLKLDAIDVDRYLPVPSPASPVAGGGASAVAPGPDYGPLRKPEIDGALHIGELKVSGGTIRDIALKVTGRKGRYGFHPFSAALYGGSLSGNGVFDVQGNTPRTSVDLNLKNIQAGPLLVDFAKKDLLAGTLNAVVTLSMAGDTPARIKPTLNGKGNLRFSDGAIKGIDLAGMARNIQSAFGLAETPAQRPSTDFSELNVPFTLTNGRFYTPDASLVSPFLRLSAKGSAHLVQESLDFRVEPKVVATIKGQGDTAERSGLMVPVLVSGTFAKPTFRPDLEGLARQRLQEAISDPTKLKETLGRDKQSLESLKEQGRSLLKGLGIGN
ncbi:MAG: AsmA family protein [Desulfobacteraceae bacterium]|nr:AsmA family protein [Desulfobacteraceae bacterium]